MLLDRPQYSHDPNQQYHSTDQNGKNDLFWNGLLPNLEAYAGRQRFASDAGIDRAIKMVFAEAKGLLKIEIRSSNRLGVMTDIPRGCIGE
jgi:hypothetical protein